ncbi:MAG TPA: TIM barrel protein, partial [Panacibacter sp.]|nr:TIM barrel protein [Panacibacter sp.]
MSGSRRNFIKTGALTLAGTAMFSSELFAAKKSKEVLGIQLYSVRDDMMKDPMGTLQKLADMGYTYVEHANYVDRKFYKRTAPEFKKILDDMGLKMRSGHTVMSSKHWDEGKNDFTDEWKYTVYDASVIGQKYVISPWLDIKYRKTAGELKRYMEVFNKSGELCRKAGMKFGYHNHDFEFSEKLNDEKVFDI